MFLIRSSTRGRERGGEGEIQFFPAHCPREPGTGRKRYRAVLEGRKRVFQLSNRIRLFLLSRLSNRSKKISIERERKRIDRIESVGGRKGGGRKGKRWKGFSFDEIESRPFYFFFANAKPLLPLHSLSCCCFHFSDCLCPTNGNDSLFIGRASRRDPISLASPPLFPPFENLSNRRNRALSPPPSVHRPSLPGRSF